MIVEWLSGIWTAVASWFLTLLPPFPVTGAEVGISAILDPVSTALGGLGGWIPWDVVGILLPVSMGLYIVGLILRVVKSLIPMISG